MSTVSTESIRDLDPKGTTFSLILLNPSMHLMFRVFDHVFTRYKLRMAGEKQQRELILYTPSLLFVHTTFTDQKDRMFKVSNYFCQKHLNQSLKFKLKFSIFLSV